MAHVQQAVAVSLVLSILIVAIAVLLVLWQWYERRHREPQLSKADASHFARQDIRRWMVAVVMILLALGIGLGSRVGHKIAGRTNPLFVQLWLGIIVLIVVLLCLAMLDWVATRLYAQRHRRAIFRERVEMIREELRRRSLQGKEPDDPRDPIGDSPPA